LNGGTSKSNGTVVHIGVDTAIRVQDKVPPQVRLGGTIGDTLESLVEEGEEGLTEGMAVQTFYGIVVVEVEGIISKSPLVNVRVDWGRGTSALGCDVYDARYLAVTIFGVGIVGV